MTEIMVPYLLNDEQMEKLRQITTAGMSPADMFISIMIMGSKWHIDRVLDTWEKISQKSA